MKERVYTRNAVAGGDYADRVDLRPQVRTHFERPICNPGRGGSEGTQVRIRPAQEGAIVAIPAIVEQEITSAHRG